MFKGRCERCGVTNPKSNVCKIKHPRWALDMLGSTFSMGFQEFNWACTVCHAEFTERFEGQGNVPEITSGTPYCYSGKHTRRLNRSDPDSYFCNLDKEIFVCIEVTSAEQAQREIDNLSCEKLKALTICPPFSKGKGYVELHGDFKLNRSFPNLDILRIIDVAPRKLVLSAKKTPKLRVLELQNITETERYKMSAPSLQCLKVRHYKDEENPALMNLIKSAKKYVVIRTLVSDFTHLSKFYYNDKTDNKGVLNNYVFQNFTIVNFYI